MQQILAGEVLSTTAPVSVKPPPAEDTIRAGQLSKAQAFELGL